MTKKFLPTCQLESLLVGFIVQPFIISTASHPLLTLRSLQMVLFIYLFINYNTITNYILIIYDLSNFDMRPESLAHYPLDYQGTPNGIISTVSLYISLSPSLYYF